MNNKIIEYRLLSGARKQELNDKINNALKNGWQLYCGPVATSDSFSQAVVKFETVTTNEINIRLEK